MASTSSIVETIDIAVPVRTAYNQWTQFEEFPQFMQGVESVKQLDDATLHWCAEIGGKHKEWTARITEQIPDKRIAWTSTDGAHNAGVVTFHRLSDDTCRVTLQLEYQPEGALEAIGDAIGLMTWNTRENLERFKEFIEERGSETGAFRGEIASPEDRGGAHAQQAQASTFATRMQGQSASPTSSTFSRPTSGYGSPERSTTTTPGQTGNRGGGQQRQQGMSSQQQSGTGTGYGSGQQQAASRTGSGQLGASNRGTMGTGQQQGLTSSQQGSRSYGSSQQSQGGTGSQQQGSRSYGSGQQSQGGTGSQQQGSRSYGSGQQSQSSMGSQQQGGRTPGGADTPAEDIMSHQNEPASAKRGSTTMAGKTTSRDKQRQ